MTFPEYYSVATTQGVRAAWLRTLGIYQDLYLRYLQARRDYPYFEHEPPSVLGLASYDSEDIRRIQQECEREFNRTI